VCFAEGFVCGYPTAFLSAFAVLSMVSFTHFLAEIRTVNGLGASALAVRPQCSRMAPVNGTPEFVTAKTRLSRLPPSQPSLDTACRAEAQVNSLTTKDRDTTCVAQPEHQRMAAPRGIDRTAGIGTDSRFHANDIRSES